jgi:hypothetical protein
MREYSWLFGEGASQQVERTSCSCSEDVGLLVL